MIFCSFAFVVAAQSSLSGEIHTSRGTPAVGAVIYLEGGARSKPLARAVVDQRGRKFIPHISVVTVGTEIDFPNNDTIFHNVFAEFDAKRFDLGMYPRGKSKRQTFNKPGLVALLCSVHSEMSAYVMVVDTPYYAIADAKGRFALDDIPNGAYTVRVWHESGEVESEPITISRNANLNVTTRRK